MQKSCDKKVSRGIETNLVARGGGIRAWKMLCRFGASA